MIISANKLMGALVFRTREALRSDRQFLSGLDGYAYKDNFFGGGSFNLWHFPGTHNEIQGALIEIGTSLKGSLLKFPALLNFHTIRQRKTNNSTQIYFNIAFVAPVFSEWRTQQREEQVFERVLRPIYQEFMKQVRRAEFFQPFDPAHDYYEVFTTGKNAGVIIERYGDYIDAIELHNLSMTLKTRLCDKQLRKIEEENSRVIQSFETIINCNNY